GTLAGVVENLNASQQALRAVTAEAAARIAKSGAGEVTLDRAAFLALPPEIARRLLIGVVKWISGEHYAPRQAAVGRLLAAVHAGGDRTLWGCRMRVGDADVRISREPRAVAGAETGSDAMWDGRWRLHGPHRPGLTLRA